MIEPNYETVRYFQVNLLKWYSLYGRNLPWRKTKDPYQILVAEKLLQQTAVRPGLINSYNAIINQYPNINSLANANIKTLSRDMQSLGLHYRSEELLILAQIIRSKHKSEVPRKFDQLMDLPGIGDYITRAILCFAYGKSIPVVDTNVARILFRVFGIKEKSPTNPARNNSLTQLAGTLVPEENVRNYNFALLDLGALICRSRNPICNECPVQEVCTHGKFVMEDLEE